MGGEQADVDLDSAGVYFISVEDFERRAEDAVEPGAAPNRDAGEPGS